MATITKPAEVKTILPLGLPTEPYCREGRLGSMPYAIPLRWQDA